MHLLVNAQYFQTRDARLVILDTNMPVKVLLRVPGVFYLHCTFVTPNG